MSVAGALVALLPVRSVLSGLECRGHGPLPLGEEVPHHGALGGGADAVRDGRGLGARGAAFFEVADDIAVVSVGGHLEEDLERDGSYFLMQ